MLTVHLLLEACDVFGCVCDHWVVGVLKRSDRSQSYKGIYLRSHITKVLGKSGEHLGGSLGVSDVTDLALSSFVEDKVDVGREVILS